MGSQGKYSRMPLPPAVVAARPHWNTSHPDSRAIEASIRRVNRQQFADMSGGDLARYLDRIRKPRMRYSRLVDYRAALHEAVVVRHWTVTYSSLDNRHHIY
jgi:hypothetical protein